MKLSALRPCDACTGVLVPQFYVVRVSLALFNPRAVNAVLGVNTMFGGRALGLAEVMAPDAAGAVVIAGDETPELMTELFLCRVCYLERAHVLAELVERRNESRSVSEEDVES